MPDHTTDGGPPVTVAVDVDTVAATTELAKLQQFMNGLLTVQQVVDTVGITHRTVTRWASSGRLPVAARIGGSPRFTAAAVQAALVDAAYEGMARPAGDGHDQ